MRKIYTYLALLIPFLFALIYFSYDILKSSEDDVIKEFQSYETFIAADLAEDTEEDFNSISELMEKIEDDFPIVSRREVPDLSIIIKKFPELQNAPYKGRIAFYNAGGSIAASNDPGAEKLLPRDMLDGFQKSEDNISAGQKPGRWAPTGQTDYIIPVIIKTNNVNKELLKNSITIYSPVFGKQGSNDKEKLQGVLSLKIELSSFFNLDKITRNLKDIKYNLWVIDKEGNIFFGPNHPAVKDRSIHELNNECKQCHNNFDYAVEMLKKYDGVSSYSTVPAHRKIAAFSTMKFSNAEWKIVIAAPSGQITRFVAKSWLKLSVLILIVFIVIAFAIRNVFKAYKNKVKNDEELKHWKEKEYLLDQLVLKGKEYEELFENNPMPMWVYDLKTLKFLLVNHAAIYHYGYTREEFLSMTIRDIRPKEELSKLNANLALPEQEIEISNSWLHKKKDGSIINVEIISHHLPVKNEVHSRLVMAKDVTEETRLDQELRESEHKYRQLVEQAMVAILVTGSDYRITFANSKACEMLNYTYEELTSLSIPDTYMEDEYEIAKSRLKNVQVEGKLSFERKVRRKDGSYFYAEVSTTKLDNGKSLGLLKDITDRKKAEEELLKSKEQYQAFFEDDLTGVYSSAPSGRIITCNPSLLRMFGFNSIEEIKDYDLYKLYPAREDRDNLLNKLKKNKRLENFEIKMLRKDGRQVFILETMLGNFNAEDELIEIKGYMIDITERKTAEDQLKNVFQIVEQNPLSIIIIDINGNVEYANRKFAETNGLTLNEITGKNYSGLETGLQMSDDAKTFLSLLYSDTDWKGELQYIAENGTVRWELAEIFTIKNPSENTIRRVLIKENITSKKKSEESLIHSEMQLRSVWENTSDAMRLVNEDGIIIKVNDAFCSLFRKTRGELEGFPFYVVYKDPDKNAINDFKNYFNDKRAAGITETESILWDSRKIWVEYSSSFIEIENQPMLLGIFRDITIRKESEAQLIAAKEKAEELNRLKSNLLENMSHELRTPMIGILGFSQLLSVNLEDHDYREMAQTIYLGGKRLLRTMDMIIDLARVESNKLNLELAELNICEAIINEVRVFESEAENKKLYIKTVIKEEKILAWLDERLFLQVFDNLLSNAIKFTNKGGITVEVFRENNGNNSFPVIKVIDTGIGIAKEDIDLIFHEFRQASEGFKRRFEGVGLGLSIAQKFVKLMNGTISVESTLGEGSAFTLRFFKQNRLEKAKDGKEKEAAPIGELINWQKNRILLVDDDENTVEIIKLILKNICVVDAVESGENALQMIKKNKYDIILMDIVLGYGMNGIETTKEIRKIKGYEKLPIVAVTAYAMPEDKAKFIAEGLTHYVSKPFELDQFRKFIAGVLKSGK